MTTTDTQTATAAHLDPARKHDFVFHFDVRDGNPNGDPDAGGMPRTDPETQQGLVTDVAIKRKIRNMVTLLGEGKPGCDIYVEAGVALNAQHKRAYTALGLK
jgi:CRISPR-associated protein Csd2